MQSKKSRFTNWRIGLGAVDITPPPGLEMAGFAARHQPAQGMHDPLRVKAITFQAGDGIENQALLLLVFDLLGISQALVAGIRGKLQQAFNLQPERVILAATHTHAGPGTLDNDWLGTPDPSYLKSLEEKTLEAARSALSNWQEAMLETGHAPAREAGRNRNVFNGPTDPTTGILAVRRVEDGELLACLVNYTCHPTVLGPDNLLYTADYPYFTIRQISQSTGLSPERIIFTQGACGDINAGHTSKSSFSYDGAGVRTYQAAEKLGGNVGQAALEALAHPDPALEPVLEVSSVPLPLQWDKTQWPELEKLAVYRDERQKELNRAALDNNPAAANNFKILKNWAEEMLQMPLDQPWPTPEFVITTVRLGRLKLVAVPCELYVEFGLALKESLGYPAWVLGYANGDLGYVPTVPAYERQDYEASAAFRYYGYPAPFAPETGALLVETAKRLSGGNNNDKS